MDDCSDGDFETYEVAEQNGGGKRSGGSALRQHSNAADENLTPAHRPADPEEGHLIRTYAQTAQQQPEAKRTGTAKVAFLRGRLPRTYAWVRTSNGTARRVTFLFDTGASHCFINPRILTDLNLVPDSAEGPAELQVADDSLHSLPGRCQQPAGCSRPK